MKERENKKFRGGTRSRKYEEYFKRLYNKKKREKKKKTASRAQQQ